MEVCFITNRCLIIFPTCREKIPLTPPGIKSPSGKLLQFFWSIFLMILVATYTAQMAAIFSTETYTRPLAAIEDIQKSPYNICAVTYMEHDLKVKVHIQIYTVLNCGNTVKPRYSAPAFNIILSIERTI